MESHGSLDLEVSPLPEDPSDWRVQLSFFAAAVLPVLWFWGQAETPAISRKVVSCILFPVSPNSYFGIISSRQERT